VTSHENDGSSDCAQLLVSVGAGGTPAPSGTVLYEQTGVTISYKDLGLSLEISVTAPDWVSPAIRVDVNQNGVIDRQIDTYYALRDGGQCNGFLVDARAMTSCGALVSASELAISHTNPTARRVTWTIPKDELNLRGRDADFIVSLYDPRNRTSRYVPSESFARPFHVPFAGPASRASDAASQQQLPPEAMEYMNRGRAAMSRGQYQQAIGEFRHVLKVSPNYAQCYPQLARAYSQLGAHKDALETARKLLSIVQDDRSRAITHNLIGVEISALAEGGKMRREEAEQEFHLALQLDPSQTVVHFNLGAELLKGQRDAEGIAELNEYLKLAPQGSNAKTARALIENPRRAREKFVPANFALVTKDGEYVTPDDVKGKVVLLDFWASWCKPCEASLPTLQRLFKHYSKDQFLLISISTDHNEQVWQRFLSSHRMEWLQARDDGSKLQRMFDVRAFPTYVLIDMEGVMRCYVTGAGTASMAQLEGDVKKSLRNAQKLPQRSN